MAIRTFNPELFKFDQADNASIRDKDIGTYYQSILAAGEMTAEDEAQVAQNELGVANYVIDRGIEGYKEYFDPVVTEITGGIPNMSFMDLAERKLVANLERGIIPALRLLDVGCGKGRFMIEAFDYLCDKYFGSDKEKAAEALHFSGITIADLREAKSFESTTDEALARSTQEDLALRGINYYVDDARHLKTILKDNNEQPFDMIVSAIAIAYIEPARMRIEVLKKIYRSLKLDGVAILSHTKVFGAKETTFNKPHQAHVPDPFSTITNNWIESQITAVNNMLANNGRLIKIDEEKSYAGIVYMRNNGRPFLFPNVTTESGQFKDYIKEMFDLPELPFDQPERDQISRQLITIARYYEQTIGIWHQSNAIVNAVNSVNAIQNIPLPPQYALALAYEIKARLGSYAKDFNPDQFAKTLFKRHFRKPAK